MSLFVIGDLHGNAIEEMSKTFPRGYPLNKHTKDDVIIQLGDFGFFFNFVQTKKEKYWLKWLAEQKFVFCFVDGNHENFALMNQEFVNCEIFGARAKKYTIGNGEIYWLQRGECYTIGNKKILTIGGATSVDKSRRMYGVDWWPEELLSYDDEKRTIETCLKHNWKFDIILSHTAPSFIIDELSFDFEPWLRDKKCPVSNFLNHLVEEGLEFDQWHFGHFHKNWNYYMQFFCHYKNTPFKII